MTVYESHLVRTGYLKAVPWFLFLAVCAGFAFEIFGSAESFPRFLGVAVITFSLFFLVRIAMAKKKLGTKEQPELSGE